MWNPRWVPHLLRQGGPLHPVFRKRRCGTSSLLEGVRGSSKIRCPFLLGKRLPNNPVPLPTMGKGLGSSDRAPILRRRVWSIESSPNWRWRLDRFAAGRSAIRAYVQVLVAIGQDEQQPLTYLHCALAVRTRQQSGFHPLERWPALLWHRSRGVDQLI